MLLIYLFYSFVLIILAYIIFRIIVRNDYLKNGKLSFVSYSLELVLFVLHANFIYLFIPVRWLALPEFPDDPILNIVSNIFLYTGLLIVILAIISLGIGSTFGQDIKILKKNGLYKYSRNPQIVGYGLFLIAFVFCYPSLNALGWFILFVVIASFMIKTDEEFLTKNFGMEYHHYCHTVPRLFKFFY